MKLAIVSELFKICPAPAWMLTALYAVGMAVGWMWNDVCGGNRWHK